MKDIRSKLRKYGLDAYLIPHNDAHDVFTKYNRKSEYIANVDERLAHISGFTGSAGIGLVTLESALLWTDIRYWL